MNIAVLISGGVDSAVVVHQLVQQAQHDLQLFYIRIGMDNDEGDCSAEEDIEMCSLIAHRYGLPLEVVSLHQEYWDNVMEYALRTVKAGLTPNPDMMCNRMTSPQQATMPPLARLTERNILPRQSTPSRTRPTSWRKSPTTSSST